MGFEYQICFSENMRKTSSSRSQLAVITCNDYAEIDVIKQEKEKFIPAYTSVRREQERKKLNKNLAAAKETKNTALCKMIENDLKNIDKKSFKTNIGRFFEDPEKRRKIFQEAERLGL
jgi:ribosomal protein L18